MSPMNWGVDSAAIADDELLAYVRKQFGNPDFWGRYLTTVQGASEGLTTTEIRFLKNNGIKYCLFIIIFEVQSESNKALPQREMRFSMPKD